MRYNRANVGSIQSCKARLLQHVVSAIFVTLLFGRVDAVDDSQYLPMPLEQILDLSTLDEEVTQEKTFEHPDFPGREVKRLTVSYYSHDGKDGPWRGTVRVYLPTELPEANKGFVAICPRGSLPSSLMPDVDMERDYAVGTALLLDIPVCTMPQTGEHFGLKEIHQLSDYMTSRFLDTNDPSWLALYSFATLYMRSATLVGKLVGKPTEKIMHMGSSITAHQGFKVAQCDPRLVGLMATGSSGLYSKLVTKDGKQWLSSGTRRPHLVRLANAPQEQKDLWLRHSDKGLYADEIKARILLAAGTTDPASQLSVLPDYFGTFPAGKHFLHVPNYPHGCGSTTHVRAFRMWIDHCFFGRPLSELTDLNAEWTDTGLRVQVRVLGEPNVRKVEIYYHQTTHAGYLDIGRSREFPGKDHYTKSEMQSGEMQGDDGSYSVHIPVDEKAGKNIAFFIHVEDFTGKTAGYTSSIMRWLQKP